MPLSDALVYGLTGFGFDQLGDWIGRRRAQGDWEKALSETSSFMEPGAQRSFADLGSLQHAGQYPELQKVIMDYLQAPAEEKARIDKLVQETIAGGVGKNVEQGRIGTERIRPAILEELPVTAPEMQQGYGQMIGAKSAAEFPAKAELEGIKQQNKIQLKGIPQARAAGGGGTRDLPIGAPNAVINELARLYPRYVTQDEMSGKVSIGEGLGNDIVNRALEIAASQPKGSRSITAATVQAAREVEAQDKARQDALNQEGIESRRRALIKRQGEVNAPAQGGGGSSFTPPKPTPAPELEPLETPPTRSSNQIQAEKKAQPVVVPPQERTRYKEGQVVVNQKTGITYKYKKGVLIPQ